MKLNKQSVLYSAVILAGSSVFLQLLGFGYRILLGRVAGPQVVAVHSLVMSAYNVVLSCTLTGIAMSVSRIASTYQALGSGRSIKRLIKTALTLFILMFFILAIPFGFYREFVAEKILGNRDTSLALMLIVPCLFLTGFENVHKAYFFGVRHNVPPMLSEALEMLLRITSAVILFSVTKELSIGVAAALIVLGMIFSEIASASLLTFIYHKDRKHLRGKDDISTGRILKDIASLALPVSISTLISRLLSAANVVLIPKTLMASGVTYSQAMAQFGVVSGMTMPMLMVPAAFLTPLVTVLSPRLSAGNALGDAGQIRRKAAKAFHVTGLIGFPAMAVMLSMGKELAVLLYNNKQAGDHLLALVAVTIFTFYYVIGENILESIGLQKRCSVLSVVTSFLGVLCTGILGGYLKMGIAGFLSGELLCSFLGASCCMVWVCRRTGLKIRWHNWFFVPVISSALAALSIRPILVLLLRLSIHPLLAIIFCMTIFALIYSVLLRILGTNFSAYLLQTGFGADNNRVKHS